MIIHTNVSLKSLRLVAPRLSFDEESKKLSNFEQKEDSTDQIRLEKSVLLIYDELKSIASIHQENNQQVIFNIGSNDCLELLIDEVGYNSSTNNKEVQELYMRYLKNMSPSSLPDITKTNIEIVTVHQLQYTLLNIYFICSFKHKRQIKIGNSWMRIMNDEEESLKIKQCTNPISQK